MGIFGWSLPPGVSTRDIDAAMGSGPCEVCGGDVDRDECCCPECDACGGLGEARCLAEHGYVLTAEQVERGWQYVAKAAAALEAERAFDDAQARDFGDCARCGSRLNGGFCTDETCRFRDYVQDDVEGWRGHPLFAAKCAAAPEL